MSAPSPWRWLPPVFVLILAVPLLFLLLPTDEKTASPPSESISAPSSPGPPSSIAPNVSAPWRLCVRVIDGDTIELDHKEIVRLIGVDTPETKHPRMPVQYYGREAAAFTRRLLEGHRVRLEYDQTRHDRYGRTLAYVYLENGTLANGEIILQGYGHAYTRFPFQYMEEFRLLERQARDGQRGLWGVMQ
jgi:endonuclease YncB( thermonuclease family)